MSGRRSTGAAATAVSELILQDRKRRFDQEDDRRKFNERLAAAGITAGVRSGQIAPQFSPQGQLTGFGQPTQPQASVGVLDQVSQQLGIPKEELDFSLTVPGQGGQKFTIRPKAEPKPPRVLAPAQQLQQDIRGANETLQRNQALPDSTFLPEARQQLLQQLPEGPFVAGPGGGFLSGSSMETLPGQTVDRASVVSQMAPGVAGAMAPQLRQPMVEQAKGQLQGLLQSRNLMAPAKPQRTTDTTAFRQDLQGAVKAVSTNRISKREAINRLLRAYPDKASKIAELEQSLF